MRGRKPTPTRLKILCGNPGKQRLPKNEPCMAAQGPLEMPDCLDDYGREEWQKIEPGLRVMGILGEHDHAALTAYCNAWSTLRHATEGSQAIMRDDPAALANLHDRRGNGGALKVLICIARTAAQDVVRYASEFGLTPSARARLGTDWSRKKGKSKFDGLIPR